MRFDNTFIFSIISLFFTFNLITYSETRQIFRRKHHLEISTLQCLQNIDTDNETSNTGIKKKFAHRKFPDSDKLCTESKPAYLRPRQKFKHNRKDVRNISLSKY